MDIIGADVWPNRAVRSLLREGEFDIVLIETPKARGMPTSNEEMETLLWIGRFEECVVRRGKLKKWSLIWRSDVKMFLCHAVAKVTDANIRAALLDYFGGETIAIGGKKCQSCNGSGTKDGGRAECDNCEAIGQVQGARGLKKCPICKGRCSVPIGRVPCPHCGGERTSTPAGPLAKISAHSWAALGVAVTWLAKPTFMHRILPGSNKVMAEVRRKRREDKAQRKLAKIAKDAAKATALAEVQLHKTREK